MSPHPPRAVLLAAFFLGTVLVSIACSSDSTDPPLPPPSGGDAQVDAPIVEVDDSNLIPCAPRAILQNVCQKCHTKPPQNGAPFPLVTRSNIVRVTSDGQIRELMIQQLETRRMPLAPVTIDDGSRTILLEWLKDGAVPLSEPRSCADEMPDGAAPAEE